MKKTYIGTNFRGYIWKKHIWIKHNTCFFFFSGKPCSVASREEVLSGNFQRKRDGTWWKTTAWHVWMETIMNQWFQNLKHMRNSLHCCETFETNNLKQCTLLYTNFWRGLFAEKMANLIILTLQFPVSWTFHFSNHGLSATSLRYALPMKAIVHTHVFWKTTLSYYFCLDARFFISFIFHTPIFLWFSIGHNNMARFLPTFGHFGHRLVTPGAHRLGRRQVPLGVVVDRQGLIGERRQETTCFDRFKRCKRGKGGKETSCWTWFFEQLGMVLM